MIKNYFIKTVICSHFNHNIKKNTDINKKVSVEQSWKI